MHKAALSHCGMTGDYQLFDVTGEDFSSEIDRLRDKGLSGFNVTIPHKMRVLEKCTERSPIVDRVGAANTIQIRADGSLFADNTDIAGFSNALSQSFSGSGSGSGLDLNLDCACILGAGGAAKAALEVLLAKGYKRIFVLARQAAKAEKLCSEWKERNETKSELTAVGFSDYCTVSGAELFVSTIPYGQTVAIDNEFLPRFLSEAGTKDSRVFDMVYSRDGGDTALVKLAKQNNLPACDGTSMLVYQAQKAFEIWTGRLVPFDIMHQALVVARKSLLALCLLAASLAFQGSFLRATAANQDEIFSKYQREALDFEHGGNKKKALETIETARKALASLPPYADKISQLRVRQAELELQNNLTTQALNSVQKLVADHEKIEANAAADGDLALEFSYLKDLLLKNAQTTDAQEAYELTNSICQSFKIAHCRPRETLQPLCDYYLRHKKWSELEAKAKLLEAVSDNPLTKMSSLAMLELSYEKQGKKKEASSAKQKLNALDPMTPQNERVWHRDMAGVQLSVRNYEQALTEIEKSISLDAALTGAAKDTQQATDLGVKADIENKLGRFGPAIEDAKLSDKLWTKCNPEIWRSRDAITFSKCHGSTLATLESALRSAHRVPEADEIRNHRRAIEYVR